jgi:hypothetical protein
MVNALTMVMFTPACPWCGKGTQHPVDPQVQAVQTQDFLALFFGWLRGVPSGPIDRPGSEAEPLPFVLVPLDVAPEQRSDEELQLIDFREPYLPPVDPNIIRRIEECLEKAGLPEAPAASPPSEDPVEPELEQVVYDIGKLPGGCIQLPVLHVEFVGQDYQIRVMDDAVSSSLLQSWRERSQPAP